MTYSGKPEDRQHCSTAFVTLFGHLWWVLKLILDWELLLLAETAVCLFLFHFLTSLLLRHGLKAEGYRKPWSTFQVPPTASHTDLIIKLLLECKSIYKLTTPLCKFPIGNIIIFISLPNPGLVWLKSVATGKIRIQMRIPFSTAVLLKWTKKRYVCCLLPYILQ